MTLPDATALSERPLLLPSVRIEGFRAFRDLTISRLGRVNLVVGQNNVGKTTLLEALRLYAAGQTALWVLVDILEQRQERVRMDGSTPATVDVELARVFFEAGSNVPESQFRVVISSGAPNGERLSVLLRQGYLGPPSTWGSLSQDKPPIRFPHAENFSDKAPGELLLPILTIHTGRDSFDFALPGIHAALARLPRTAEVRARCRTIPAQSLASDEVGRLWDGIVLTDLEEEVAAALRLIAPEIERISLTEDRGHYGIHIFRLPFASRPSPRADVVWLAAIQLRSMLPTIFCRRRGQRFDQDSTARRGRSRSIHIPTIWAVDDEAVHWTRNLTSGSPDFKVMKPTKASEEVT